MTSERTGLSSFLGPAEGALVALTLATIVGFGRIFASWDFLGPMVLVALYAHGITLLARRRGLGIPITALIAVPGFVLLCIWLFLFHATTAGIPTGATLDAARNAFNESWDAFQSVVAPAPTLTGFVLASCAAVFFAVFLADWAAFRLWSALEAIVPASTLFIFCSLLGSDQHQIVSAVVFSAALLAFLLLHRVARQESAAGWLTTDVTRGSRALARTGLGLGALAVVIAGVVVPRIPLTQSPAVVSWRGQDAGPGSRVTISPLVDIHDRLLTQKDVELFTVRSKIESYWRLTSLDTFEGDIWRSGGKYSSVDGDLEVTLPSNVTLDDAAQDYTIENLSVLWLPAAFVPTRVSSPNAGVRYQQESSTLIVDTDVPNSNGLTYQVQSKLPTFTAEELRGAGNDGMAPEQRERYTKLPAAFSDFARNTALAAVAGASTPYDKARKLQDYFRTDGGFQYTTDIPAGHSPSAIDSFLTDKQGYCEQFAGAYAAMARSLGLPARVAVGFTSGTREPDTDLYHVRGEHAHAWPEVYLGSYGWVAFEPTPNRGAPNAQSYTGATPQQEAATPVTPSSASVPAGAPTTVVSVVPAPSTSIDPNLVTGAGATPTPEPVTESSRPLVVQVALVLVALLLAAGLYAGLMAWLWSRRRRRRHAHATDDRAKVKVAWQESVEALALLGTRYDPAETHEEFAHRAQPAIPETGDVLVDLAHDVDAAAYAPDLQATLIADRSAEAAGSVLTAVRARASGTRRARHLLDPRPFLPRRRHDRHRAGSAR